MTLPTYGLGTITVAAAGTVVTLSGGVFTGGNVAESDYFTVPGVSGFAVVTEVTDATHLKTTPWTGAAQSGAAYSIVQNYVGRVVGVAAAQNVANLISLLGGAASLTADNALAGKQTISNTTDATSISNGGAWTNSGGAAIAKKLFVGAAITLGSGGSVSTAQLTLNGGSGTGLGSIVLMQRNGVSDWDLGHKAAVLGSGTSNNFLFYSIGYGSALELNTATLAATFGGALTVPGATTLSAALTYGGVTLNNAVTGTGNMVLSASPTFTGIAAHAGGSFSSALAISDPTVSTSTTTGALTVSGGLGVAGAGWFGGNLNVAASFGSSASSSTTPHLDSSGMTGVTVLNGANAVIAPGSVGYGLLIIAEYASAGVLAIYVINGGSVSTIFLGSGWVAATSTPAATKFSVSYDGVSAYRVYNNFGSSCSFKCTLIKTR
jgi:hypothetical protein